MKTIRIVSLLAGCIILAGCFTTAPDTVFQTSTIDAILAGVYDGNMKCSELLEHGDFGIGTFDRLDGEMIVMDGHIYQVKADGKVYEPPAATLTPFATVCRFRPDATARISRPMAQKEVEALLDRAAGNTNMFVAVRITGRFKAIRTRSVPAQGKPYPPLKEVAKTQPEFPMENVTGTVIGFRCPAFAKGVNVPGYHLHFLDGNHAAGGHVLGFELSEGRCEVDVLNKYFLVLPRDDRGFAGTDLSADRSDDLDAAEK